MAGHDEILLGEFHASRARSRTSRRPVRAPPAAAWNMDRNAPRNPAVNDLPLRLTTLIEREFGLAAGQLTPRSRLHDFGDSLDWFSLLGAVEDEFGIEIPAAQESTLDTVGDLLRLLEAHDAASLRPAGAPA